MKLGFIGTGTIAAAFISGLKRAGTPHEVVVSPRSEAVSTGLAAQFPGVSRAASNVAVAEAADIVFLAMWPTQLEDALTDVRFRPGQVIVSFVAGLPLAELQALAPECRVARALPLPAIAHGRGPLVVYPRLEPLPAMLDGLGTLIWPDSEREYLAASSASAFMSSYFELQQVLIDWTVEQGTSEATAAAYVRAMLEGLAHTGATTPVERLHDLPHEHQTKGGLNERVRQHLLDADWFAEPIEALDAVMKLKRDALE